MKPFISIYKGLNKISDWLSIVIEVIVAFLLFTCSLDLAYQVLYRFIIVKFITISSPFTEEYARYGMIWMGYLGIALCYKEANMPVLDLLYANLKGKLKYILFYATRILMAILIFIGIKYGYKSVLNNWSYTSPVLELKGWMLYSAPFVAFCLMGYEMLVEVLGVTIGQIQPFEGRRRKTKKEIKEGDQA